MAIDLNKNITVFDDVHKNTKAAETYIHVNFDYPDQSKSWDCWVPTYYRRTHTFIHLNKAEDEDKLNEYLNRIYDQMDPDKYDKWLEDQNVYWADHSKAKTTKSFFDGLVDGNCEWKCAVCTFSKLQNSNPTRRIQTLKEMGYTISTDNEKRYCATCKGKKKHYMLLPIERSGSAGNGYEDISPKLRKRIHAILGDIDACEGGEKDMLLIDHKFPECRWDDGTKGENPDDMPEEDIRHKFQLLSNQRNEEKREVCRNCFENGERGTFFGIKYYYEGGEKWDASIPERGPDAEKGCLGCPWYDFAQWKEKLHEVVERDKTK